MTQKTLEDAFQISQTPPSEPPVATPETTPAKATEQASERPKPAPKRRGKLAAQKAAGEYAQTSIAKFFEKNKHILGFNNPTQSLITAVKEAVDNALDACEQGQILPKVEVRIEKVDTDELRIIVTDNGPGVVDEQVPHVFGRLLYGSRFGSGQQSRGQQGIGISAAIMYGQLTTGRSAVITSTIGVEEPAYRFVLKLDTQANRGVVHHKEVFIWRDGEGVEKEHGTAIEMVLKARYREKSPSVQEYLKATAIVNPHAQITFIDPSGETSHYPRVTETLPQTTKKVKPHPHGVELGELLEMLHATESAKLDHFLRNEFSRVTSRVVDNVLEKAYLEGTQRPADMTRLEAKRLLTGFTESKLMAPPTDCLSPIGEMLIKKGLKSVLEQTRAEYYTQPTSRAPSVFAGTPFLVEVGMVYGGTQPRDQPVQILRFANRVPLLYQQGACVITKSVQGLDWRRYGLEQRGGKGIPIGPAIILVHVASTNVPFTSEAKEAIANIAEIQEEIKRALRTNANQLRRHLGKQERRKKMADKFALVQKVLPAMAEKSAAVVGKPVPRLDRVVAAIMDLVWITDEVKYINGVTRVELTVTNYRLRQDRFELMVTLPPGQVARIEPDHATRKGERLIWTMQGLAPTESRILSFEVTGLDRGDYDEVQIYVTGINPLHILGAEVWTAVD